LAQAANNIISSLENTLSELKSREILQCLNNWQIEKIELVKLIIQSKSAYDQAIICHEKKKFFNGMEDSVYSLNNYSRLIMSVLEAESISKNFGQNILLGDFYFFHKTLVKTANIVSSFLGAESTEEVSYVEEELVEEKVIDAKSFEKQFIPTNISFPYSHKREEREEMLELAGFDEGNDQHLQQFLKNIAV
jgi:hypothetical protein